MKDIPRKATAGGVVAALLVWLQAETPGDPHVKWVLFGCYALFVLAHFLTEIAHLRWGAKGE